MVFVAVITELRLPGVAVVLLVAAIWFAGNWDSAVNAIGAWLPKFAKYTWQPKVHTDLIKPFFFACLPL